MSQTEQKIKRIEEEFDERFLNGLAISTRQEIKDHIKEFYRQKLTELLESQRSELVGNIREWINKKSLREQGLRVPDIEEYFDKLLTPPSKEE